MRVKILCCLLVVFITGCNKQQPNAEEVIKAVKVQPVTYQKFEHTRRISGVISTTDKADLSFRVPGIVAEVKYSVGQKVEKDQVIATLDQGDYELAIVSANAKLQSGKADLTERNENLNRQTILLEKGFISNSLLEKAQAEYAAAVSTVKVLETQLKDAELNLQRTQLRAPFTGKIANRYIEPFMEVSAGVKVFEVQGEDSFQVEALLPETLVQEVALGDPVVITMPAFKNVNVTGNVSGLGSKAESGNAFSLKVRFSSTAEPIKPGMTADLTLSLQSQKTPSRILIPTAAIDLRHVNQLKQQDINGKSKVPVFLYDDSNQLAKIHYIEIGDVKDNQVEVLSGLDAKQELIVAGVAFLYDGQKVKRFNGIS